ncbi:MAG: hypothetical protein Q9191_000011 [Dirinaria sp. TL-2023a]
MQFRSFVVLALSTISLALPAEVTNEYDSPFNQSLVEQTLEKRATNGWITSYADSDPQCKAGYALPRPKVHSDCITFHPTQQTIGINWGTSVLAFDVMTLYTSEKCAGEASLTIKAPKHHHRKGPQTCYNIPAGMSIQSVFGTKNSA